MVGRRQSLAPMVCNGASIRHWTLRAVACCARLCGRRRCQVPPHAAAGSCGGSCVGAGSRKKGEQQGCCVHRKRLVSHSSFVL